MWIIRGWAARPPYGELPAEVHRLLPKVDAAIAYARSRAEAKQRGGMPW